MKKLIILGLFAAAIGLGINVSNAAPSRTIKADIQSVQIPKGTILKLQLVDPISSKTGSIGDEFNAMLLQDQIVEGKIALPAGSIFRGTINKIVPSKRLSRCAVVYINFDHVVTPTGRQIQVAGGLMNYPEITLDGGIYQGGNYGWALQQNWEKTKQIAVKTTNWGKGTGDNMQYVCTPIGAVGGVIGGGAYLVGDSIIDLFRRGSVVTLPQGKVLDILLTQPIDLPLH